MDRARPPRGAPGSVSSLSRFLLLILCLTGAAVNTGNNLLYLVLSLMVAVAVVAFLVAGRSLRRLRLGIVLPDEVPAGDAFLVGVEASSSDRWLPTGAAEVTLSGWPGEATPAGL